MLWRATEEQVALIRKPLQDHHLPLDILLEVLLVLFPALIQL